jgi:predicted type IV restriction endonuclease
MTCMNNIVLDAHERALQAPEKFLGTVERNTEVKTAYLALWALGWDPIEDIALGFHIARSKLGEDAKMAQAADFALRDEIGLCAIGEAKQWFMDENAWSRGIDQLRRYQKAVPVPRAFLTCGRRWLVLDEAGRMLIDVEGTNSRPLIETLRPHVGKGNVSGQLRDGGTWDYGINPSGRVSLYPT